MNKKQLQTLIESNVRSILAEQKRKVILEQKMNSLLQEAKKVKKQKAMLNESIRTKKVALLFINESIQFHEGIWDSIKRGIKGVFGGGLGIKDLEDIEKEKETAKTAAEEKKIIRITSNAGEKIDKLSNVLNAKFSEKSVRTPEVEDLEALNAATNEVYSTVKELENSEFKDAEDVKQAIMASLIVVKTALSRLNSAKETVKANLEKQIATVQDLLSKAETAISNKFNEYASELEKLTPEPDLAKKMSIRGLLKAAKTRGSAPAASQEAAPSAEAVPVAPETEEAEALPLVTRKQALAGGPITEPSSPKKPRRSKKSPKTPEPELAIPTTPAAAPVVKRVSARARAK